MDEILNKVRVLKEVKLFIGIASDMLEVIAEGAEWQVVHTHDILFSLGDNPDHLYIIASGAVEIISDREVLAHLKEFDFFGELGIINDSERLATAKVVRDGLLLTINKIAFDEIVDEYPEVLREIAKVAIKYLKAK